MEGEFESRVKEYTLKEMEKVERDLERKYRANYEKEKRQLEERLVK